MQRYWIVGTAVVFALLAFSLSGSPQTEIREETLTWAQAAPTDGAILYRELCAVCHGVDGVGDGPAVAALAVAPPDLTRLALAAGGEFPFEDVEKAIAGAGKTPAHGSPEMPIWGQAFADVRIDRKPAARQAMAEVRVRNLTRYLESIQVTE